ncbi:hypothetical protein MMC14_001946 [Varicellaria rhodocarpa]|nr:hypothetical protein [Varicellaria rhodocarpa]
MNWTGGRLQRSKRAGTALSAKQKAHFAKARTHIQSGHENRSPVRFSILQDLVGDAPQTHRVDPHTDWKPGGTSNEVGSYAISPQTPTHVSPSVTLLNLQPVVFLESLKRRGKRPPSVDVQPRANLKYSRHEVPKSKHEVVEDLKNKRLELLQRNDWSRAPTARPLKMKFSSANNRHKIGRRRRLTQTDIDRRNQGACVAKQREPWEISMNLRQRVNHSDQDDGISIRIGSSIHGTQNAAITGLSSYSIERFNSTNDMLFSSVDPSEESSSMLLDADPSELLSENSLPLECSISKIISLDEINSEKPSLSYVNQSYNRPASIDRRPLVFSCSPNNARDEDESTAWILSDVDNSSITLAQTSGRDTDYTNPRLAIESSPPHLPEHSADRTPVATRGFYQSGSSGINEHPMEKLTSHPEEDQEMNWKMFLSISSHIPGNSSVAQISANGKTNTVKLNAGNCAKGEDTEDTIELMDTSLPINTPVPRPSTSSHCFTADASTPNNKDAERDTTEEDALWWNFVFGETENKYEETSDQTVKRRQMKRTITGISAASEELTESSSMMVEASQATLIRQKHVNHDMRLSSSIDQNPSEPVKIVFKKPAPFVGRRSTAHVTTFGKDLASTVHGTKRSAKQVTIPFKTTGSERILIGSSSDEEEGIED